jgi:hypothetical protein
MFNPHPLNLDMRPDLVLPDHWAPGQRSFLCVLVGASLHEISSVSVR